MKKVIIVITAVLAVGLVIALIVRLLKKLWTNRSKYDTPFVDAFKKREKEHPLIQKIALQIGESSGKVFFDSIPILLQTLLPFNIDLAKYYGSGNPDPDGLIDAIKCEAIRMDNSLLDFFNELDNPNAGFLGDLRQNVKSLMETIIPGKINSMPIAKIAREDWNNDGGNWEDLNENAKIIIIYYTLWNNLKIPPCIRTKIDKLFSDGAKSSEIIKAIADMAEENKKCSFFCGDGGPCEQCHKNPAYLASLATDSPSEYEQNPLG